MKKILSIIYFLCLCLTTQASGDSGTEALGSTASTLSSTYLPAVTMLCYAIAAIIAVIGAFTIYVAYYSNDANIRKKTLMLVGSCIMFLAMAIALPEFYNIENTGASGEGYTASNPSGSVSGNSGDHLDGSVPSVSGMTPTADASRTNILDELAKYDNGFCLDRNGDIDYEACMNAEGDRNVNDWYYDEVYSMLKSSNGDFQKVYSSLQNSYYYAINATEPGPWDPWDYQNMMTACDDIASAVYNCLPNDYVNGDLQDILKEKFLR